MPTRQSASQNLSRRQSIRSLVRANAEARRHQFTRPRPSDGEWKRRRKHSHGAYRFVDVAEDLAATPGKLEIHPTKGAPTLQEIQDDIARERDKDRMKFFSVPIKVYETEDEDEESMVYPSDREFTEEDRAELHRYGSRVVMNKAGHVVALEVRKDIMKRFKPRTINVDFCQCLDVDYEVSSGLKKQPTVRRHFMQKVLFLETLLKIPALGWLMMQQYIIPLHDFLYEEELAFLLTTIFLFGARIGFVYCCWKLSYKRSVLNVLFGLTCISYCFAASVLTTISLKYFIKNVQHNQYKDPTSLKTLYAKYQHTQYYYPYYTAMFVSFHIIQNIILIGVLQLPQKIMDEMKNGYLLVIFLSQCLFLGASSAIIFKVNIIGRPGFWDGIQIGCSILFLCKWVMWRFYVLQELLRGKVTDVSEDQYKLVALRFSLA